MTADAAIAAAAPARVATWALVVLLVAFVLLETLIDVLLGRLGSWFEKKRRAGLLRALEGLKSELLAVGVLLMLLSFVEVVLCGCFFGGALCLAPVFKESKLSKHNTHHTNKKQNAAHHKTAVAAQDLHPGLGDRAERPARRPHHHRHRRRAGRGNRL